MQAELPVRLVGRLGAAGLGEDHQAFSQRGPRNLLEDPLLEVERLEDRAVHQEHLGAAQEQVPVVVERVVEAG